MPAGQPNPGRHASPGVSSFRILRRDAPHLSFPFASTAMRTYDKLIATISVRRSADDARPCSGRETPPRS